MTQASDKPSPAPSNKGKGVKFFDQADKVAEMGNWDYAIDMYLEGIKREPDNLERGYKAMREMSLKRKAKGGKGVGMMEQLKRRPSKDPTENLMNALYLLAKEPGSTQYMEMLLSAVTALNLPEVIKWIAGILMESQRVGKPSKRILTLLISGYQAAEEYALAIQACEMARKLNPDDAEIQDKMRELSAQYTIKKGQYDKKDISFADKQKDKDGMRERTEKDKLAQSREFLLQQVQKAKDEYLLAPTVVGKINAYVDALLKVEDEGYDNEAIDVLTKSHKETGAYQFKMRIGDIRIKQMTRRYHALMTRDEKDAAAEHRVRQLAFELEEYVERAANYPTDLAIKYELGRRQYLSGKLDDAIGSLQQAQRDPRRHVQSLLLLGQAFAKKGWNREASETFERALQTELTEDRAKEVRYYLGDVLERLGENAKAQEQFSQVAQLDYNYRDVRDRLESIRKKLDAKA